MAISKLKKEIFAHNGLSLEMRSVEVADAEKIYHFILRNKRTLAAPFPVTTESVLAGIKSTRAWIRRKRQDFEFNRGFIVLVCDAATADVIFIFSAFGFDWRVPRCEISWMLDEQFYGKGIAKEVTSKMIQKLFTEMDVFKVICRIEPGNERSKNLAKNLNFVYEGTHFKDFRNGLNQLVDVEYYGLCRN